MYEYAYTEKWVKQVGRSDALTPTPPLGGGWELVTVKIEGEYVWCFWKRLIVVSLTKPKVNDTVKRTRLITSLGIAAVGIVLMFVSNFINSSIGDRASVAAIGGFVLGFGFRQLEEVLPE